MQELMSRHKTYSLSPRDCLKTCLFQKWQRMVAPPGRQTQCTDLGAHHHTNSHNYWIYNSPFIPSLQLSHRDRPQTKGGSVRCQVAVPSAEEEELTTITTTKRKALAAASPCPAKFQWVLHCYLALIVCYYTSSRNISVFTQKLLHWFINRYLRVIVAARVWRSDIK